MKKQNEKLRITRRKFLIGFFAIILALLVPTTSVWAQEIKTKTVVKAMNVYTIQPCYEVSSWSSGDEYISMPDGIKNQGEIITAAGDLVAKTFSECSYNLCSKDEPISKETIQKIGKNQIVLLQGHGNYREDIHSVLQTNRIFNPEWLKDPEYLEDYENGRIIEYKEESLPFLDGNEAITAEYIRYYGNDMTGSLIYIGACQSGKDDVLANAFLEKNAEAVIVCSETINAVYGDVMQYTIIKLLTQINPKTNNYYNLEEALEEAKVRYGKNDAVYDTTRLGAKPVIYGNAKFRIADIQEETGPDIPQTSDQNYLFFWGIIFAAVIAIFIFGVWKRIRQ